MAVRRRRRPTRHAPTQSVDTPLLEQIWANSLDALALSDHAGRVVRVNAAYLQLYGYQANELLGHDFAVIFPEDQRVSARAAYQTIFAAGQPVDLIESRVQRADGRIHYVETRAFFVQDGPQRYLLSLVRDVTDRHVASEALHQLNLSLEARVNQRTAQLAETIQELLEEVGQRSRAEYDLQVALRSQQAIILSASCGIITTGLDGLIRVVNPAAEQLLGYQAVELIGRRNLAELHDPEDLAVRTDDLARRLGVIDPIQPRFRAPGRTPEPPFATECLYRRHDGSRIAVTLALSTLHDGFGAPEGQVAILTDNSRRNAIAQVLRQANEQLHQANCELARASRLKDEFLANMSHELRTPLQAILGGAELLQELGDQLNARQQRTVQAIEESGRHLLALINDLLDLSKISSGRIALVLDSVSLAELASASLRLVSEAAQQRRLSLSFELDPAADQIVADPRRLKQALVNLLSNAIKFTPEGGKVGLVIKADAANGLLQLRVWDTGIGIAPADQHRLFQPFVQLDSSLARQYAGTGLGLSLVKRLIELHGGTVSLQSTPGQGSCFTLSLPWHRSLRGMSPAPTAAERPERTLANLLPLVLLVGTPHEAQLQLRELLAGAGYPVVLARTAEEALTLAGALQPGVLVVDDQRLAEGGFGLAQRMRAEPELQQMPILALVVDEHSVLPLPNLNAGPDLVLTWSESPETILAALDVLQTERKR